MVSVVMSTYKNVPYLYECLDSIDTDDIIIGIDGCKESLEFAKQNPNLAKWVWFSENHGPFIVKNNIYHLAKYDKIVFFDTDDIMHDNLLWKVEAKLYKYPVVQFKFQNFKQELINTIETSWGVFGIRKETFEGFQNWKCNADVKHILRMKSKVEVGLVDEILFYRREHETNLTRRLDTGMGSDIRNEYEEQINQKVLSNKWPIPEIQKVNYEILFT